MAAAASNADRSFTKEVNELKKAFSKGGIEKCRILFEKKRDEWKNIPLNVAVIGNSGVGKSSFINAIRRLTADDEGAADVGVAETTEKIQSYAYPNNPKFMFWDLPGVGTDRFPKATYLDDIEVDRFDFFLLITATRFTENDTWLGKEFRKRNKGYFFIRTKIGMDVFNNVHDHPTTHSEEAVVKSIRESTAKHLRDNGCEEVPLFLIDNHEVQKFQFKELEQQLVTDFPMLKRSALILSLQALSIEVVQLKVAELRARMWKVAGLSGAVAALTPLPGLALAFDFGVVLNEYQFYLVQLSLDETSMKRYAKLTRANYQLLQDMVNRTIFVRAAGTESINKLVANLSLRASALSVTSTYTWIKEGVKFIPIIGSFLAVPLSFTGTYLMLNLILNKMETVAVDVMTYAAKLNTTHCRK